jgi:ribosomal protein S18 acetylase RimI-like enzyme
MSERISGVHGNEAVLRQVAAIHSEGIASGFLSSLGPRFLTLLYGAIASDRNSVLLVERGGSTVVGFVAGGTGMGSIYRQLLKRWPLLVFTLFPVLFSPTKLSRLIELLFLGKGKDRSSPRPAAELFSIAVVDAYRNQGVAHRLYESLAQYLKAQGHEAFCIVVGEALKPAHRFYRKMGAVPLGEITVHAGERSVLYTQGLGT